MPLAALRSALAGFAVRPAAAGDAAAVTALVAACETVVHGHAEVGEFEFEENWARPGLDLARDTVVVLDAAGLAAYAEVYRGERAEAWVAPGRRGLGIGSALAAWWIARAAETGSTRVGQTVADEDDSARAFLEAIGCRPAHTAWILDYELGPSAPPAPALPPGFGIRAMAAGEERRVFEVIDHAFSEWEGRAPGRFADWAATSVASARFEAWMAPVIVRGEEIVGAAILAEFEDEGWVQQIAVDRDHRGLGLGRALLADAFRAFWGRRPTVGLSTDSRTGALDLYLHVGMRIRRSYTRWSVDLHADR